VAVKVSSLQIHPLFNEKDNLYNVAILTLDPPTQFSSRVNPICLVSAKSGSTQSKNHFKISKVKFANIVYL